jgi:uncharacterized protein YaaN involved in tellurite resistance
VNVESSLQRKYAHLDDDALEDLFERNRVRIERLRVDVASVRAEQASIRAEMKRRQRELWL